MKTLFYNFKSARDLKRLAKENAEQDKPLSVMNDVVFKAMLSSNSDDSREALRSLLSACTRRKVSSVRVLNSELVPVHLDAKTARLDVHATFNDGETADLEMQAGISNDDLKKRAEYYSAMLLAGQAPKGKFYRDVKRVYQIFFLNCTLFPKSSRLPRRYYFQEETEHDRLSETTEIIFYELPKLEDRMNEFLAGRAGVENLTAEEKWCLYMRYRHEESAGVLIGQLCRKEEGIMRAEQAVTRVSRDMERYARKIAAIKNRMDRASDIDYARRTGHAEGRAEGRAEGLQEGLEKEQKAREEERQRFLDMLNQGLTVEEIKQRL